MGYGVLRSEQTLVIPSDDGGVLDERRSKTFSEMNIAVYDLDKLFV